MNFLAHIFLSGESDELKIGNFIGDFVKASDMEHYNKAVNQGIRMHWAIDEFTDHHDVVQKSKDRLRPKYGHYAGVIVDIYYDHFLARNWKDYHSVDLRLFVNREYKMLENHISILPKKVVHMLPYMIKYDWLFNYQYFDGIERVMHGMANRSNFNSKMEQSVVELKKYHKEFEKEFQDFFPELQAFCEDFLENK
ncbi:Acyl carrier protein phosphodiesterase [Marivirga sericea]|uniref:Acyl carrier protein phosphodiesterase n=1 Tax=Marivirga sericea TaxID=1028 RepID=A0A1X7K3J0_9BACT|nr:acyl carrier protein phosphodiesterase [Marivirga sericea]SMG35294.1 Acyl carrier protein phosphodiesterase [Marivirga sericea]